MTASIETLKAMRAAHLLGLGVSFAGLVLLFAPEKPDYSRALSEAVILNELEIGGYQRYARRLVTTPDFLPVVGNLSGQAGITEFLENYILGVARIPAFDYTVLPALDYEPPPVGGTLADWLVWINSKRPAFYWRPDWSTAVVSLDTRQQVRPKDESPRTVMYFLVTVDDQDSRRIPQYKFLAFLEDGLPRDQTSDWWTPVVDRPASQLWDTDWMKTLAGEGRSVVEGVVYGPQLRPVVDLSLNTGSINAWLKDDSRGQNLFSSEAIGTIGLPGVREHWSNLSDKTLPEAIAFMGTQQRELQSIELFGVAVPGGLCIVGVPFAFCVAHLYLLMHLRSRVQTSEPTAVFPWIGLYGDPLASSITFASLVISPVLLSAGLVVRYHLKVDSLTIVVALAFTVGAAGVGILTNRELVRFRQERARGGAVAAGFPQGR